MKGILLLIVMLLTFNAQVSLAADHQAGVKSKVLSMMDKKSGMMKAKKGYGQHVMAYQAELQLTDVQLGQIARIVVVAKQGSKAKKAKMKKAMMKLKKALVAPTFDAEQVRTLNQEHNKIHTQMAEKGIEVRQKIAAILTSSQRTQMHKRLTLLMKKD
ncbi:MAG TPA: periplasmic heavy metal sensor [Methylococcaceae bacterium]|jgi:Spy/CpxP family protein refolding chaperone|nr:periplasmic heavy metal sensor [Methylococcaceae bacterium]HHZ95217.1 periplasmic heavy metal sensor [Flavobacteriales bacterium]HIB63462.1 periplasmic heavy metal sensor [Methylococcaceae bacterium]HIO12113.1 periplasmic heavy metal sensor [Methylococcales bacterium]HIO43868.1 periplasmic heavy metal sensor [Methylococcales bacterium]